MSDLHSYPKVYAIGHGAIAELFDGDVLVEEKIDGSQFSFGRSVDGELLMRSRGATIVPGSSDSKMFAAAIATVQSLSPNLIHGWTYRCEYLAKPKHNVLRSHR